MGLINQNIESLKKAEGNLEKVAQSAVRDNMDFIMFLLKENQLGNGVLSDGSLAPTYDPSTIGFAEFDTPRTGVSSKSSSNRYNFEWSGQWLDSMYIKIEKEGFDVLSRDYKTAMLEKMVKGKLTALTPKNNEKVNDEIIMPKLFDSVIDALLYF